MGVVFLLVLLLVNPVLAINADSLGGNPWTFYIRSDSTGTTVGNQYMPAGATIGEWGAGECKIPFCTQLDAYNETGPFGQWSMNGSGLHISCQDLTLPRGSAGITFDVRGAGAKGVIFQFSPGLTPNEYAALIFLSGNGVVSSGGNPTEMIRIGEIPQGGHGVGSYIGSPNPLMRCAGYYNDVGANGDGVVNEINFSTRPGDRGQLNILDYIGGARGTPSVYYDQGSNATWPMIVFTGSEEYLDSAMIYRWGMVADSFKARSGFFGRKAEVETVKTMLCGKRSFGNNGRNLCDTIILAGTAENTTVVTASYSEGFESATCTALRIKVAPDTIIIKRGYDTDPVQYYWQAQKIIDASQIPPSVTSSRPGKSSPAPVVPAAATLQQSYPNPAVAEANICYQVSQAGRISLAMYNMLGQKVKTLVDQWQPAGSYTVNWNGQDLQGQRCSAGIYFYKLYTEQSELTRKLVLAR
jgi:hypothetical protein